MPRLSQGAEHRSSPRRRDDPVRNVPRDASFHGQRGARTRMQQLSPRGRERHRVPRQDRVQGLPRAAQVQARFDGSRPMLPLPRGAGHSCDVAQRTCELRGLPQRFAASSWVDDRLQHLPRTDRRIGDQGSSSMQDLPRAAWRQSVEGMHELPCHRKARGAAGASSLLQLPRAAPRQRREDLQRLPRHASQGSACERERRLHQLPQRTRSARSNACSLVHELPPSRQARRVAQGTETPGMQPMPSHPRETTQPRATALLDMPSGSAEPLRGRTPMQQLPPLSLSIAGMSFAERSPGRRHA